MPCSVPWAGAFRQSGNWIGVFRSVADFLARGLSAGRLDAEASRSEKYPDADQEIAGFVFNRESKSFWKNQFQ